MIVLMEHEAFAVAFQELYGYAMHLIEEANRYLDREGIQQVALLKQEAAALYSAEAVRLGSRLMLVASWLLLQRAEREQDIDPEVLVHEKQKVMQELEPVVQVHPAWPQLPERFRQLAEESWRLAERVRHMGRAASHIEAAGAQSSAVNRQLHRLEKAFGSKNRF